MKAILSLITIAALVCTPAFADEKKEKKVKKAKTEKKVKAKETSKSGELSPEDQAKLMQEWAKLHAKGEQHAEFAKSAGTWNTVEKHFMGDQVSEGKGVAKMHTILDGRYLVQEYESESAWGKFGGFGITAYDNSKKQYVVVWMDSMSTNVSVSNGKKKGNTTIYNGKQKLPDGSVMHHRMVLKDVNPDKMVFTMHSKIGAQAKFTKNTVITYTRVK